MVSCEIPHDNEVLATYELDLLNIPEQNELLEKSNDGCLELFEGYVGVDYASSSIEIYTLRPTEESWEQGDRSVNCIGYDMNLQKLNKSIKASGI